MNKPVVIGLSLAVLLLSCACCVVVAYLAKQDQDHYGPLSAACEGRGVPGAAAYQPGTPARIVYFEKSATTWIESNMEVPGEMRGTGIEDTAIVACAADDTTRQVLEQCSFRRTVVGVGVPGSEMTLPRIQLARHVELRIAATGALLAQREVLGGLPPACDDWVGRRPTAGHFEGPEPDVDELAPFFRDPLGAAPVPTIPNAAPDGAVPTKL